MDTTRFVVGRRMKNDNKCTVSHYHVVTGVLTNAVTWTDGRSATNY